MFLTAVLAGSSPAVLAKPHDHAAVVPLADVIAAALAKRLGKFLEAELEETRTGLIYEIEILGQDHVIYKLKFTAHTGQFLGEEED